MHQQMMANLLQATFYGDPLAKILLSMTMETLHVMPMARISGRSDLPKKLLFYAGTCATPSKTGIVVVEFVAFWLDTFNSHVGLVMDV